MKLLRLAGIILNTTFEDWMIQWNFEDDGVVLSSLGVDKLEKGCTLYVSASIHTDYPQIQSGFAVVPKDLRVRCEKAIELLANLISVQARCTRGIMSFRNAVVFAIENDEDLSHLNLAVNGIDQKPLIKHPHALPNPKDISLLAQLIDRKEGVALLADAISHSSASGRYRDFIRLFENAFGLKPNNLGKKMTQFLNPKMGYTRQEIESWLSARDGISHADLKKRDKVILASDVSPFIYRMEQAAFDVLYNKAEWSKPSKTRKEIWSSNAMSTNAAGGPVMVDGVKISINFTDAYGVFAGPGYVIPADQYPSSWWPRPILKVQTRMALS